MRPEGEKGIANAGTWGDAREFIPTLGSSGVYLPLAKWRADGARRGR